MALDFTVKDIMHTTTGRRGVPNTIRVNLITFHHGVHGVSRRKDDYRIKNSVFLRVLRGFFFLSLRTWCLTPKMRSVPERSGTL